jgi:CBS domain containing-hemolysin-like protein
MVLWNLILILVLVTLNGFFVSVEFAAVASRRARIELLAEAGSKPAQIVKTWLENPHARDRLIAAAQLGITIVSLALGAVGENTFEQLLVPVFARFDFPPVLQSLAPILAGLPLVISLVIVTSLHVVLGEQVPKVATLHKPEEFALVAARPMQVFTRIFKWFIDILDWATRHILSLVGIQMVGEHMVVYTVEEIKQILSDSEEGGVIKKPEREMLHAIFDLGELLVRQVMIPRTEILAVEADTSLEELVSLVTQTSYTKLPVYENNLDQIIGILHVKDLLRILNTSEREASTARQIVREALFVPETISVEELLHQFRLNRQHIAIVLDEYGGTAGLVTLEDLLEEIVGEVSDPFDPTTPDFQKLSDGSVIIDGMTLIEEVNQQLGLELQDSNYDTIAGYVLGGLGHIPRVGDSIEKNGVMLRVVAMDNLRIASVSLTRLPPASG